VIAALATALAENLPLFAQQGFAAFAARWNARHAHAGREVNIIDHGKLLHSGRAIGVDANGCLLLDTAQGSVAVVAGDVSLRAIE
jgi:BirA family biotin operon repressor/biotin-[acetyl-CoA-carboxylase] ligase